MGRRWFCFAFSKQRFVSACIECIFQVLFFLNSRFVFIWMPNEMNAIAIIIHIMTHAMRLSLGITVRKKLNKRRKDLDIHIARSALTSANQQTNRYTNIFTHTRTSRQTRAQQKKIILNVCTVYVRVQNFVEFFFLRQRLNRRTVWYEW